MDVAEVSVCSREERRFGELGEHSVNTVCSFYLCSEYVYYESFFCGFRLQEQPAEREGSYEPTTQSH